MNFDEMDIKLLIENFDDDMIKEINMNNVVKIFKYLDNNGIYYAKDLFLVSLDLFLLPCDEFINRFESLKSKLGKNYIDKLGEDVSLIEIMYED